MPPLREQLMAELAHAVQESDPARALDSIEVVAVRASLARRGLEHPQGPALPQTIQEWVEWAVRCSNGS